MWRVRGSIILLSLAVVGLLVTGGLLYLKTRIASEQLRTVAERTLNRYLNLPVQIGQVSLLLLQGRVELRKISIGDLPVATSTQTDHRPDEALLTVDRAVVTVRLLSLVRGALQMRSLMLYRPQVRLTDSPVSSSNLAQLVSSLSRLSADQTAEGFPISLEQGTVVYQRMTPPLSLGIDGLRGRIFQPSTDQTMAVVETDDMTLTVGTSKAQHLGLHFHARHNREGVQIEQLTLVKGDASVTFTGSIRTGIGRQQVELLATGQLTPEALPSQFIGVIPWNRHLTLKGKIDGDLTPRSLKSSMQLDDATGRRIWQMNARVQDDLLTLERLLFVHGSSRLAIGGTIDLKTMLADLSIDLQGRLEEMNRWPQTDTPLTGPILARLRLRGTPLALDGDGQVKMRQVRIGTEQIDTLAARLAVTGTELMIPSLTARFRGVPIKASAAVEAGGRYRFTILPARWDVASIRSLAEQGAGGTLTVALWGAGQWPEPHVEGELTVDRLNVRGVEVGSGRIRFTLEDNRWHWELAGGRTLHATGVAPLLLNGPLQVEVSALDLDLDPLFLLFGAQRRFPLRVRADGAAELNGTLPAFRDLNGWIDLTGVRGTAGATPLRLRRPTRLTLQRDKLQLGSLELTGPDLSVAFTGHLGLGGQVDQVDLSLSGHAPFDLIGPWVPALRDLRGAPQLQLSFVGQTGALRVNGHADLAHIQVKPKIVPIWITVKSGEVVFDNNRVRYTVTEGTLAGGPLQGEGTAQRQKEAWQHMLKFDLEHAQLDLINDQLLPERRWVSGHLSTHASLSFDAKPDQSTIPTLNGRLSMRLDDGSLSHYPALVRLIGILGAPAQPYRLPDLTRERMPYRRISADIIVKDGMMETKNLLLDSEVMRLTAVGQMTLADQRVDLDVAVRPLQVLEQGIRRIPLLGRLLPRKQSLAVTSFHMRGPWDDPTITIAPVESLTQTARNLLRLLLLAPWRAIAPTR